MLQVVGVPAVTEIVPLISVEVEVIVAVPQELRVGVAALVMMSPLLVTLKNVVVAV